jgi:hypothetical protein
MFTNFSLVICLFISLSFSFLLSFYLSVCLSVYLSFFLSVCLCLAIFLSPSLSTNFCLYFCDEQLYLCTVPAVPRWVLLSRRSGHHYHLPSWQLLSRAGVCPYPVCRWFIHQHGRNYGPSLFWIFSSLCGHHGVHSLCCRVHHCLGGPDPMRCLHIWHLLARRSVSLPTVPHRLVLPQRHSNSVPGWVLYLYNWAIGMYSMHSGGNLQSRWYAVLVLTTISHLFYRYH